MKNNIKFLTPNPKESANCFSKLLFLWFIKLCRKSSKKGLKVRDLYAHQNSDNSKELGNLLEKNWINEIEQCKITHKHPSLYRAIKKSFMCIYILNGLVVCFQYVIVKPIQPILLLILIQLFMQVENGTAKNNYLYEMCLYGILILIVTLLSIFLGHHNDVCLNQIGMRVRVACCSLIYRKVLRLSLEALNESTAGQVVNLLSNDVSRFDLAACYLHHLWIMPILTTVVAYYIWLQIGVAALVGVISIFFLTIPVNAVIGKLLFKLRLTMALKTDTRIRKMSEIIAGIQVIKMYAWENPFAKLISIARSEEIDVLKMVSYLRGIILSSFNFMQRAILLITVVTYVSLGNVITSEKVFSMSVFFNILQISMAVFFSFGASLAAETLISINRVQDFLMLEEKTEAIINRNNTGEVTLKNVNASWTLDTHLLNNINLEILPGSLCAIVGPVGSGKSSILHILLGELIQSHGTITVGGQLSYASQVPWLFSSTVQKNILFGQKYEKLLYKNVTTACALATDFELLPQGDATMVGERGVSLSGGQKARISLARAVYRDANIYLLDDPLSAVDTQVGKQLFNDCICGYLKNKTRILITHQLQYLKKADHIVVINNGGIEAQGTFESLLESELDFTKILVNTNNEEKEEARNDMISQQSVSEISSVFLGTLSYSLFSLTSANRNAVEEERMKSDPKAFQKYARSGGNVFVLVILILLLAGSQFISNCSDFWIAYWIAEEATRKEGYSIMSTNDGLTVYSVLTVLSILLLIIRSLYYFKVAMTASKNLHNQMFSSLLQTPIRFFDLNPSGRILNRFSRDMGMIDEVLPRVLLEAIQIILILVGILIIICITNTFLIIAIAIVGFLFNKLRRLNMTVARDLKYIEGIMRSPIFSHVNASINGITTIRANRIESELQDEFDVHQDSHTSAWYLVIVCVSSFGIWLDLTLCVFITCVIFGFIIFSQNGEVNGSYVGLAISQALSLTGLVQYGIKQCAEVVGQLTSVERVLEYINLDKEESQETPIDTDLNIPWPTEGQIIFSDVNLQYSLDELPMLEQINFTVEGGEKIGIVGRTGAGKSSLVIALFRLAPIDGLITIDKVNTKTISLSNLRRKISIIPQEPVLFSATLRYNLDPFEEYGEPEMWKALEDVNLKYDGLTLDYMVQERGNNFSVGQRQLICLARAILRNNKILIMDEATANVDQQTDTLIQKTIRSKFKECTVLTIAHRLNTIIDVDKVLVMDAGKAVEYDHPHLLLQNLSGFFSRMVSETGVLMEINLRTIAEQAYKDKINMM